MYFWQGGTKWVREHYENYRNFYDMYVGVGVMTIWTIGFMGILYIP